MLPLLLISTLPAFTLLLVAPATTRPWNKLARELGLLALLLVRELLRHATTLAGGAFAFALGRRKERGVTMVHQPPPPPSKAKPAALVAAAAPPPGQEEMETAAGLPLLDLPELALDRVLEELSPASLAAMACVCAALRDREVLHGKGRKVEKLGMEHTNNSKLKRKDDKTSTIDTDRKDKTEAKRKKFVDEDDDEVDNTEMSFADLVFSKVDSSEPKLKDKPQEADGKYEGLVIDHTKKRKKSKDGVTISDLSTLKMLSSVPEVGAGGLGLSGWDD